VTQDYSDLEPILARENDLILLGFNNGETMIPLQVMARVEVPYLYDPIAEGQLTGPLAASPSTNGITNTTFQTALQLGSSQVVAKPTDIFDLSAYPQFLYQAFVGIDPPWLRVFLQQPFRTDQRSLPIVYFTPSYPQEGYWDGYTSPVDHPSRKTQMWIPPGMSIALGYANIEPQPAYPLLYFYINMLSVAVVADPEVAWEMVSGARKTIITTVGGLANTSYKPAIYYGISGFKMTATKSEVAAGVAPTGTKPILGTRQVG
jgi:hypothetical protein